MSETREAGRKLTPLDRLVAAMNRCAQARGEADWTNGYRAAASSSEEARLFDKERNQWERAELENARFRRLAARVLREARGATLTDPHS